MNHKHADDFRQHVASGDVPKGVIKGTVRIKRAKKGEAQPSKRSLLGSVEAYKDGKWMVRVGGEIVAMNSWQFRYSGIAAGQTVTLQWERSLTHDIAMYFAYRKQTQSHMPQKGVKTPRTVWFRGAKVTR